MRLYQSLTLAFAMYSKLPMPRVEWHEDSMAWVFCCFPLVGAVIGMVLYGWLHLAQWLTLGSSLTALGGLMLPLWISGGIHMDGLCDTCDALGSHQTREKKLEILKDSRTGAFGVIGCGVYLIALYAGWTTLQGSEAAFRVLALIPVFSRGCSSLMAVSCPNARGSGLLFTFTQKSVIKANRLVSCLWLLVTGGVILFFGKCMGVAALVAMGLASVYYLAMSKKEFGGITGDLEGWYLQMLELFGLLAVAVVERGMM